MSDLPAPFTRFREDYPEIAAAYEALGDTLLKAGPLDNKTRQFVKLSLAVGAGLEGAVHSHTHRALEIGITPEEIKQAVLQGVTTLGFPATIRALTWIGDILDEKQPH